MLVLDMRLTLRAGEWLGLVVALAHINEVTPHRARLVLGRVTASSHLGRLSLAIRPWVDEIISGHSHSHCWGKHDKFCIILGPATRNVGTLT